MPLLDQEHNTFQWEYDLDGTVWVWAKSHAALVKNTGYKVIINENGYVTAAQADDVLHYLFGAPAKAAAAVGEWARIQIGGRITALITASLSVAVGHALHMYNGAIVDKGADYTGVSDEFAACVTASTSSATQDVMLIPREITATT
jgi:hypothetical protein